MSDGQRRAEFAEAIVNPMAYDAAIDWIKENLEPQDVFDNDKLSAWAVLRGWTAPEVDG
jgi:hypothetical protein